MRQRRRAERGRYSALHDASQPLVSRRDLEERQRQLLLRAAAVAGAFILIVLVVGWYITQFQPPRRTIATVDGQAVKVSELVPYTLLYAFQAGGAVRPDLAMNDLVRNRVLDSHAGALGVVITESEIEDALVARFEPLPPGSTTPADALSDDGRAAFEGFLDVLGVDQNEYEGWLTGQLYVIELQEHFRDSLPGTMEQVYLEWIVTELSGEAQSAREFIDLGQDFGEVARLFNTERLLSNEAGVVGWVPRRVIDELDDVIFDPGLELNSVIGPVTTTFGSAVIRVTDGPSEQPVDDLMAEFVASADFQDWLDAAVEGALDGDINLSAEDFQWVVDQII